MIRIKIRSCQCNMQENKFSELDEGRKDDAINFVKKIPPDDTEKKQKYDNALKIFLENPIAENKYILWMLKHLEEADDANAMISAIKDYDLFQKNIESGNPLKDINNIKSFEDLKDVASDYEKSIKELEREGQKVVVSKEETGGKFEVIRPMNVYASCDLGKTSRWCIAATKSRNYYRNYSKRGILFYTIIDYSKPVRDPSSMFTYAIKKDNGDYEIYNAIDDKVERENVEGSIGQSNENNFFDKMMEEMNLNIPSQTSEKYNTFFSRIIKFIKTLPKVENNYTELPENVEEKYVDMETEVEEYLNDWKEKYVNSDLDPKIRKDALRHMVFFAKKIADVDNGLAKYRIGTRIKHDFVGEVPQLREPMIDLVRDPKWLQTAKQNFINLSDSVTKKQFIEVNNEKIFSKLFEFAEQAIYNDQPEFLERLYEIFNETRKGLNPNNSSSPEINKYEEALDSITKAAVFSDYPNSLQFLINKIDNNAGSLNILNYILFPGYGIANDETLGKKYADGIFDHMIKKYAPDERYGSKVDGLFDLLVKVKWMDKDKYQFALDKSHSDATYLNFPYWNDINVLDLKYQKKIADKILQRYEGTGAKTLSGHTLANSIYGICRSDSLPKQIISRLLTLLFSTDLRFQLVSKFRNELFDRYANDDEIDSESFKDYYTLQKSMSEGKYFKYDSEYKIYRVIR